MKIELGKTWGKKLQGRIQSYEFDVGVLEDKAHLEAVETPRFGQPDLRNYAGGSVRRTTRQPSGMTIGEVLVENMKRLNINLLLRPFQEKNSEILKFTETFLKFVVKRGNVSIRRVENLVQAIVRNPILRQEYGQNSTEAADLKGFDRHLIDTGQTFKAIKARARRVRK